MVTADPAMPRPAPVWAAVVVGACLAGLCVAWAGANPPAASPDEPSHFVKAYASGTGQFGGRPYPREVVLEDRRSLDWFRATGRSYRMPAGVVPPPSVQCFAFKPDTTPACQDLDSPPAGGNAEALAPTHLGTNPALYVPAGLAARSQIGFGMQARYVLPLAVGFPLLAVEILSHRSGTPALGRAKWMAPTLFTVAGAVQLVAFVANAHRYAVGRSASWTPPWTSQWSPDGGLLPWLAFVVATAGGPALLGPAIRRTERLTAAEPVASMP